ncbi:hypothetical protein COB11_00815 [Candidatus Aerophobetes bacterium]|uniref:Uncharacterized protein n=1 Tax=Aerophobetes bacterium TaxID=2030807 RepID=A0A2A4YME2_UNCAE|nr:MAG: hypothetical protein COB11_00815 [Candidatus Aerophobetes bacterium]
MSVNVIFQRAEMLSTQNLPCINLFGMITVKDPKSETVSSADLSELFLDKVVGGENNIAKHILTLTTNKVAGPETYERPCDSEVLAIAMVIGNFLGKKDIVVFSKNAKESIFWSNFGFVKVNPGDNSCNQMCLDKNWKDKWKAQFKPVNSN